jgi:hypothetical protein
VFLRLSPIFFFWYYSCTLKIILHKFYHTSIPLNSNPGASSPKTEEFKALFLHDKGKRNHDNEKLCTTWPHLLDGEFIDKVMVMFVECAVQ